MKKLNAKNSPTYSEVYQYYKGNQSPNINIDVVLNTILSDKVSLKTISLKWKDFYKFFFDNSGMTLVSANIYETLKYHYGRCDFKVEGNREYKNYVVEYGEVVFILSSKIEYVTPRKKVNLPDAVIGMYYELFKMTIDYLDNQPHTMEIDSCVEKWRRKGILVGKEHKSLVSSKK